MLKRWQQWGAGLAVAVVLACPAAASAQTFVVNTSSDDLNDGTCTTAPSGCTLREAVSNSSAADVNDRIEFAAGIPSPINLHARLTITESVEIVGPGANALMVRRTGDEAPFPIFYVIHGADPLNVSISGLRIAGGLNSGSIAHGGGIYFQGDLLSLDRVVLEENSAQTAPSVPGGISIAEGGGLGILDGSAVITNSTFVGNYVKAQPGGATNTRAQGGGIWVGGLTHVTLANSTVSGNQAGDLIDGASGGAGGGIANNGSLAVTNTTISGNTADDFGGGIDNFNPDFDPNAFTSLNSVTLANNRANADNNAFGAGGGTQSGSPAPAGISAQNTLYYQNVLTLGGTTHWSQCNGYPHFSGGYNQRFEDDADCKGFGAPGDILNNGLTLDPLADNGGFTQTHKLTADDSAVGAGNPAPPGSGGGACPATDQRGLYRGTTAGRCDIGAFELAATVTPPPTPGGGGVAPNSNSATGLRAAALKKCKKKKSKKARKKCRKRAMSLPL